MLITLVIDRYARIKDLAVSIQVLYELVFAYRASSVPEGHAPSSQRTQKPTSSTPIALFANVA
jgi:hypothetical protein